MRTRVLGGCLKEILRTGNVFQLKVIQQFLADREIQAVIMDEHSGTLMGGVGNILPRLMVLEEDLEHAVGLIKKHEEGF